MHVSWLTAADDISPIAEFFVANIDERYISHSEVQWGLASDPEHWSPDLAAIIAAEITRRSQSPNGGALRQDTSSTLVCRDNGALAAIANLSFFFSRPDPYCVIDDIIVSQTERSRGIGTDLFAWIENYCIDIGIGRIFFESGVRNEAAHRFFERQDYRVISKMFFKDLG